MLNSPDASAEHLLKRAAILGPLRGGMLDEKPKIQFYQKHLKNKSKILIINMNVFMKRTKLASYYLFSPKPPFFFLSPILTSK